MPLQVEGIVHGRMAIIAEAHDRRHHVGEDRRQRRRVAGEIAADAEEAADRLLIARHAVGCTFVVDVVEVCRRHSECRRRAVRFL